MRKLGLGLLTLAAACPGILGPVSLVIRCIGGGIAGTLLTAVVGLIKARMA